MFEFDKKYRRGKKTFFFLYIKHAWLFVLVSAGLSYLAWSIYAGGLNPRAEDFFGGHPDWYITPTMFAEWVLMLAVSVLLIGSMRARIMYAHYKFLLDDHAFNLQQGFFFTRETTIPYQQISNVNITRPYHYRIFGIAQLDILTAADKSAMTESKKDAKKMLIPVIDVSIARELSKQLMECASRKRRGEDLGDIGRAEALADESDLADDEQVDGGEQERDNPAPADHKKPDEEDLYPTIDLRSL